MCGYSYLVPEVCENVPENIQHASSSADTNKQPSMMTAEQRVQWRQKTSQTGPLGLRSSMTLKTDMDKLAIVHTIELGLSSCHGNGHFLSHE